MRHFRFLLTLLWFVPLAAQCEVTNLTNVELQQWMARGVPVVDVRTAGEWRETGVIKGSHLLTFFDENGRADVNGWMAQLSKIAGPNDPVVIVCRSGHRSSQVARFLDQQAGYKRVGNLERGIREWIVTGNPVVKP